MRHLRSILYALVLAPAVWILCGVGFDQDLTGRARDNGGIESLTGMLLLLLAGAAYAILLFSPISPAGPLLAGLALLGVGAWARLSADAYAAVWPSNVAKDGFDLSTPGYGLVVLLAVPMVCTALSARRWAGFEPPQILLIGTIGRARGAAQVAGTTMASERTTLIPTQHPAFRAPSADPTQVVFHAAPAVTLPTNDDEKTTVMRVGRPEEKTTVVPIARPEEKTTAVSIARPDETTTVVAIARPDEETTRQTTAEATTSVVPVDDDGEKTTVIQLGSQPTVTLPGANAATASPVEAAGSSRVGTPAEDATEALGLQDKPTDDIAAVEQPTEAMAAAGIPTHDVLAAEETTHDVATADENTRVPDADAITRDMVAAEETTRDMASSEGALIQDAGQAHKPAQAVASDEPAEAMVTAAAADEDEKTQVFRPPAATSDPGTGFGGIDSGEQTQVIRAAEHGEETQVIRLGRIEPPGDRTQLLTFSAPGEATVTAPAGERATQETAPRETEPRETLRQETTTAMSIVGEERPDPGEDPTTRLTPPAVKPGTEPGAATTRPNKDRRAMTVTNLERPADEAADDTRPLAIPAPRRPADDDTTRKL